MHHALPHLFEDGDAARVSSMNFTVTLPALSLAARSGRTEILELLLQRCQMDLHKDAPSIAIAAARSGHVSILSQLWKNGITTSPWAKRDFMPEMNENNNNNDYSNNDNDNDNDNNDDNDKK